MSTYTCVTEKGGVFYINSDWQIESDELKELLKARVAKFLHDNPDYDNFIVCVINFENYQTSIFRFEIHRKITCRVY